MTIPADVTAGDPNHDDHHDALHVMYNTLFGLASGRVPVADGAGSFTSVTTASLDDASTLDGDTKAEIIAAGLQLIDEDNMASDSATEAPSQQSVKAYVDTQVAAVPSPLSLIDEDSMATDSATRPPSQQSTKAYVDAQVAASALSLIDEDTMTSDSATRPPSQQSVKAYVDAQASGTGTTRNTHDHDSSGALSITRAAADQDTVITVTADATSWTNNLTTDRDHLSGRIEGDSGSTETYTLDIEDAFDSIAAAGNTTLDFGAIPIQPDTKIEYDIVRNDDEYDLTYRVLRAGTAPAAAWTVTWTDGDTQVEEGTGATGSNATFGAGILVSGGSDSPNEAYDDGSGNQPVIRVIPDDHTDASEAVSNSSYIQFALTGTSLDAGTVSFDVKKGGTSDPRGWELRSSADSYAASLGTGDAASNTSYNTATVDVSALAATTDLTFRLYVYTPSSASVIYVDNFSVEAD